MAKHTLDDYAEPITLIHWIKAALAMAFIVASLLLLALPRAAWSAPVVPPGGTCGAHQATVEQLRDKYKESPIWYGLTGNGAVMQLYASKNTWTMLLVFPNGNSCLVGAGDDHEMSPLPVPSKDI